MSYSHNTDVRHDMVASRRAARSTRRTCRRTRTVRSQHASRRSAAVSTRIVERRGLPDEKDLLGMMTAAHSTMTLQAPNAGLEQR